MLCVSVDNTVKSIMHERMFALLYADVIMWLVEILMHRRSQIYNRSPAQMTRWVKKPRVAVDMILGSRVCI